MEKSFVDSKLKPGAGTSTTVFITKNDENPKMINYREAQMNHKDNVQGVLQLQWAIFIIFVTRLANNVDALTEIVEITFIVPDHYLNVWMGRN